MSRIKISIAAGIAACLGLHLGFRNPQTIEEKRFNYLMNAPVIRHINKNYLSTFCHKTRSYCYFLISDNPQGISSITTDNNGVIVRFQGTWGNVNRPGQWPYGLEP